MRNGYVNLTASDGQTSNGDIGEEYNTKGATYLYTKANAIILAFQLCYILDDGTMSLATAALLSTTKPTAVVIPQFGFASGDFGLAPVGPFFLREDDTTPFKVISKIAAKDVVIYGTTTPGSVKDAVTNPPIQGLTLTAAQAVDDTATACVALRRLTVNC